MRFKFVPLEERILLDAAGASQIANTYEQDHSAENAQQQAQTQQQHTDNPGAVTGNSDAVEGRVLVISSQIHDSALLGEAAKDGVTVITYDFSTSLSDLAQTIADKLGGKQASSIGFAMMGADGKFTITDTLVMTAQTLESSAEQQSFWKEVGALVKNGGSIDILSCDLAINTEGLKLVTQIDNLVDNISSDKFISVNASMDKTGNADQNANWTLEIGNVDAVARYFDSQKIQNWEGVLDAPYLVKDVTSGYFGSVPQSITQLGDKVVFVATTADYHFQLWVSDGTNAGTQLLKSDPTWYNGQTSMSSVKDLVQMNNKIYFTAPDPNDARMTRLWSTDGTAANTVIVKAVSPSGDRSSPGNQMFNLTKVGNYLYFTLQGSSGNLQGLWKSDGTTAGTVLIRNTTTIHDQFTSVGSKIFFTELGSTNGTRLVSYDGGAFTVVKDGTSVNSRISNLTNVNGVLYFSTNDSTTSQLWKSDGTMAGTRMIDAGVTQVNHLTVNKGVLYFEGYSAQYGYQIFKSDGTAAGTQPLVTVAGYKPVSLVSSNGTLFWIESNLSNPSQCSLYASDGTSAGTRVLLVGSFEGVSLKYGANSVLTVGAGTTPKVFFFGSPPYNYYGGASALYVTDGTNVSVYNGITSYNGFNAATPYTADINNKYERLMLNYYDSKGRERFFFQATYNTNNAGTELFSVDSVPTGLNKNYVTSEDTLLSGSGTTGLLSGATDAYGNSLNVILKSNVTNGTLTLNANGTFSYVPKANFIGTDSFTYTISNGNTQSSVYTANIAVTAVNDAPIAQNVTIATNEDTSIAGKVTATDIDSSVLTYSVATAPLHGTLTLNATTGDYVYTPAANYYGADSFTFKASDGLLSSVAAKVTINVAPVNDAPVAVAGSATGLEDTQIKGTLKAADIDSSTLTYSIVTPPKNGKLTLSASTGAYVYTPNANFNGTDSFTFKASDGALTSEPATINLTITPVNDAPVSQAGTLVTLQGVSTVGTLRVTDIDSTHLTYSIVTQPQHGTIALNAATGDYTYTPTSTYVGSDTFAFNASDGSLTSKTSAVSVTVEPFVGVAPTAQNSSATGLEDSTIKGTLLATDSDSATLTYTLVSQPSHGTVTLDQTTGNYVYTPNANYNGTDSFTYKANDGALDSNVSTVTINVTAVSDAPVAAAVNATTLEDVPIKIIAAGSDIDSPALTYSILTQPAHGTVTKDASGNFIYTPASNYSGTDSFTYKANDGALDSNVSTVTINVTAVSDAPVTAAVTATTLEDVPIKIIATGSDIDSPTLTYSVVTQPAHGTVTKDASGNFIYTPASNYNGTDSFTYKANDGALDSNVSTVTINVTAVSDAPVTAAVTATTPEDVPIKIIAAGSDIDSPTLTYSVVTQPAHGTVTKDASGNFIYTPAANYNGSDTFTYKANDGSLDSNVSTVTINVTSVDDAPVTAAVAATTNEDTPVTIAKAGSDIDSAALTYSVVTQPAHGTVTKDASGNLIYTPAANYSGPDSFTYKANDGTSDSNISTVTINVTPVNDAPVISGVYISNTATGVYISNTEDTSVSIALSATDVDSAALTYSIVTQPSHGTLTKDASGYYIYTPSANYTGRDTFTYKANDGSLDSNIGTVVIDMYPVNDAPVSAAVVATTAEDSSVTIIPSISDVDSATLTYSVVTQPAHGTVTRGASGYFIYTPAANYSGTDTFTYKANDGKLDSNISTVTINVTPVNDAPFIAKNSVGTTNDNVPFNFNFNATDIDSSTLTYSIVTQPEHGTITQDAKGNFTYTPDANFVGTDTFTYKANDGYLDSNVGTVTMNVLFYNNPPVSAAVVAYTMEDSSVKIDLAATDIDSATLTYSVVTQPAHGTVTKDASGNFIYTPTANYSGSDTFTYKANDGSLDSNVSTVTINIAEAVVVSQPDNQAPKTQPVAANTAEDVPLKVILSGSDVDSAALTYSVVTQPTHGTVTKDASGNFIYTPAANYNGSDSFTYKANDGSLDSNVSSVTINVAAANDAPVTQPVSANTAEDVPLKVILSGSDIDSAALTYSVVTQPAHGTVTKDASGNFIYTPAANYNGTDSFTYKANDGTLDSNVSNVTINVAAANDAPVTNPLSATTAEDTPLKVVLKGTDSDSSTLTYSVVTQPAHGTISKDASGNFIYTPAANYNGPDSFTYKADDGSLDSNVSTVSINVTAVNDAPITKEISASTAENVPLKVMLVATDPDSTSLTYSIVNGPAHGTISKDASGNFIYTPAANYSGPDSFTYKANDGNLDSNISTVSINVTAVNDAPITKALTATTMEDVPLKVILTGTDVDSTSLSYSIVTQPAHGTISKDASGNFIYTPAANYNGPDSFTYKANDGTSDSNVSTVTINVTSVQDAPVIKPATFTLNEDTSASGTLEASDADSSTLKYSLVSSPTNGTLLFNATNHTFIYTPKANFSGSDSFTYSVSDGSLTTKGVVNFIVAPINDAPATQNATVSTLEDTPLTGKLLVKDVDSTQFTYQIVSAPSHGTVSVDASGNYQYKPNANYSGTDSFTFKTNDGQTDSNLSTINITIKAVNDAPTALSSSVNIAMNTPLKGTLTSTDVDSTTLSYTVTSKPLHGTITVNRDGSYVYTPAKGYSGTDAFSFKVNDGKTDSANIGTVKINVGADSSTLTTATQTETGTNEGSIVGSVANVNSRNTIYTVQNGPAHGTLTFDKSGSYTYVPNKGYTGQDSFSYFIKTGSNVAKVGFVNFNIEPFQSTPSTTNPTSSVPSDSTITFDPNQLGSSSGSEPLHITLKSAPAHGTITQNADGSITYKAYAGYTGRDSFRYIVTDKNGISQIGIVKIDVTGGSDKATTSVKDYTGRLGKPIPAGTTSPLLAANMPDEKTALDTGNSNTMKALLILGPIIEAIRAGTLNPSTNIQGKSPLKVRKLRHNRKSPRIEKNRELFYKKYFESISKKSSAPLISFKVSKTIKSVTIDMPKINQGDPYKFAPLQPNIFTEKSLLDKDFAGQTTVLKEDIAYMPIEEKETSWNDDVKLSERLNIMMSPNNPKSKMDWIDKLSQSQPDLSKDPSIVSLEYNREKVIEKPAVPEKQSYLDLSYESDVYSEAAMSAAALAVMEDLRHFLPEDEENMGKKIIDAVKKEKDIDHFK